MHYIEKLIAEGEHVRQDFKFRIDNPKKIAKTLSSFANTKGGLLLVGVKDNGAIAGVRSEEEFYVLQAAADMYTKPTITLRQTSCNYAGKQVLIAEVFTSAIKPVCALDDDGKWKAYLRVADENILANSVLYEFWKIEGKVVGEVLECTEEELCHLKLIEQGRKVTLSAFIRNSFLPRKHAIKALARFMHFGIITYEVEKSIFYFTSTQENA